MERKLDNKMKRELSYLATLNDRNISLVSIRKKQAARDVPELLIIGEKSKTASPVKAGSNLQKEEKLSQSYSMGMTEVNTAERQVSELGCGGVCVGVCACWEGSGVSELVNLKQSTLDMGCILKEVKPSLSKLSQSPAWMPAHNKQYKCKVLWGSSENNL